MNETFKHLRLAALLEGSSLIALVFIAMPLKYVADIPLAVKIIGPIHGGLFLLFVTILLVNFLRQKLNVTTMLIGLVASFIPFGTFIYKSKYLK